MSAATPPRHPKPSRGRNLLRMIGRVLSIFGLVIGGLIAYFICQGMFGGYPQVNSFLLTTIGMILISLAGGAAWIIDERRPHDDDD